MRKKRRGFRKAGVVAVSLLLLWATGCATVRGPEPMTAQQTDALKARLGKIGVVAARYVPKAEIQVPAKGAGQGAAKGAAVGAMAPLEMLKGGASGCNSLGCALLPAIAVMLMPVGAVVGTVGGAITADSAEAVNERETKINDAMTSLRMQEAMRDRFSARVVDMKTFDVSTIQDAGPAMEGQNADYRQMKSTGIDTVNEIIVQKLTLKGEGKVRPDLALHLAVKARVVSAAENAELYAKDYTCASNKDKFEAWAEQNARKFQDEIDRCYNDIAMQVVKDVYVNDTLLR
ncbi:MAG: hypothetical protein OEW15_12425 [Nitrospirota bacterium]|nr:hypothetical protein [Nitrospirota bacterium]